MAILMWARASVCTHRQARKHQTNREWHTWDVRTGIRQIGEPHDSPDRLLDRVLDLSSLQQEATDFNCRDDG
jgi:hypothetical protein